MNLYNFELKSIDEDALKLSDYEGKVLLLVNTASKCGFTPQYEGLQKLHETYADQGLVIIGFPCNQFAEQESGTATEVKSFCSLNYGVTFPLSEKIDVRGETAHPLFKYLTEKAPFQGFDEASDGLKGYLTANHPELLDGDGIKWNFTKFLIDRKGESVQRFESVVAPEALAEVIKNLL